jgi:hypothetical protein
VSCEKEEIGFDTKSKNAKTAEMKIFMESSLKWQYGFDSKMN